MEKIKQTIKRLTILALAAVMVFSLSACGDAASGDNRPEWVYVPEFTSINDERASYYGMHLLGDYAYYITYEWNEETEKDIRSLCKYSLVDGSATTVPLKVADQDNASIGSTFAIGADGAIYILVYVYSDTVNEQGWVESENWLYKFDAEGNQLYSRNISAQLNNGSEYSYFGSVAVDGEGRVYLQADVGSGTSVLLYDKDGNYSGAVEMDSSSGWIRSMGSGKDGKVYICYYSYEGDTPGNVLVEIDFNSKKTGESYADFPNGNNDDLVAGIDKDFLVSDGTTVYEYDLATQTKEVLFDWLDSDINGSYVNSYGVMGDGRIVAVVNDWATDENEIALLTKTKGSEMAEKQYIVLATFYDSSDLKSAAVKFNRSSQDYHISIKRYYDYSSGITYEDAIANLNNDITSKNCPDILDVYGLNVKQLVAKDVFVDMNEYLEKSGLINRSDFLENILEAYTFDDKLICIPYSFQMQTLMGWTADVGEEMGWTIDELIAYADSRPEANILDNSSKREILMYMMVYNEDAFIDWESGSCSFNSDQFKKVLEFVNRFPDEVDWNAIDEATPTKIQNGTVLLYPAYIYDFDSIQQPLEMYEQKGTCIGYPTIDGSAGCMLSAEGTYAITTKSKVKDGAWAFIESYLTRELDNRWRSGFPTRKSSLEEMKEEALRVDFVTDENGELVLDENGDPIPMESIGMSTSYISVDGSGGWSYTYHNPTQEEVDMTMALIEVAKPVSYTANDEVSAIIMEEAEAYFKGQKTVDEVADIIQSRIQIFVSENS